MLCIQNLGNDHFGPVSLDVPAGDCVAIQGPSGAGKTVFLRAIADLDPNQGEVSWRNRQRSEMPAPEWRRLVGYVPAETGWWADDVGAHFPPDDALPKMLAAVGLPPEALGWRVARLSTGERHRLGLLRALLQAPEVLLLDEPTASLDQAATAKVEELIRQRLASGVAVILVTHDPGQARRLAGRTFTMVDGKLSGEESVLP